MEGTSINLSDWECLRGSPFYARLGGLRRPRHPTLGSDIAGRATGRWIGVLAVKLGPAHFEPLADRCVAGDVSIHIDRTFGLADVPEALAYVGAGRALGKIVIAP